MVEVRVRHHKCIYCLHVIRKRSVDMGLYGIGTLFNPAINKYFSFFSLYQKMRPCHLPRPATKCQSQCHHISVTPIGLLPK